MSIFDLLLLTILITSPVIERNLISEIRELSLFIIDIEEEDGFG